MFGRRYKFSEVDYGSQGSLFTFQYNHGAVDVITSLIISTFPMCLLLFTKGRPPEHIDVPVIVSAVWFVGALLYFFNQVILESILIVSSIGATVKTSSYLSSETQYYDVNHIQDIVIVEAISMHCVHCQLVLLPKIGVGRGTNNKEDKHKLIPLFLAFKPRLQDLKIVYRHIQEKLIIPYQQQVADR